MEMTKKTFPANLKSFEVFPLKFFDDDFKHIIDSCTDISTVTDEASAAAKNIWSLVMNDSSSGSSDNDLFRYPDEMKDMHSGFSYSISCDKVMIKSRVLHG